MQCIALPPRPHRLEASHFEQDGSVFSVRSLEFSSDFK